MPEIHAAGSTRTASRRKGLAGSDPAAAIAKAVLCALLGLAVAGMPLAMLGVYHPWVVAPLAGAAAFVLWRWWRLPIGLMSPSRPWAAAPGVLALSLVLLWGAYNAKQSGEHVLVNNDPGVYAVTGKWLSDAGRIKIDTHADLFGGFEGIRFDNGAFAAAGDDELYPQFAHFLPAVLATGEWLGGSWLLLKLNALIGAVALLMVHLFVSRVTAAAWQGLLAAVLLAATLPQVYFSRTSYSEPLQQALLFGGLWVLMDARDRADRRSGLVAGLLLGATVMTRLDGLVLIVPLAGYLLLESWRAPRTAAWALWAAGGLLLTAALGVVDIAAFAPFYIEGVRGEAVGLAAGALGLLALGALPRLAPRVASGPRRLVGQAARRLSVVLPISVSAGAAWLVHRNPVLVWYLGIVPVGLGIAGLGLLWRAALVGRGPAAPAFLLAFTAVGAVYLYEPPNITPLHVEVMRRYLPLVIPGTIVCAVVAVGHLRPATAALRRVGAGVRLAGVLGAAGVAALLVAMLWVPARVTWSVRDVSPQVGMRPYTESVCGLLPKQSMVMVSAQRAGDTPSGYPLSAFYATTLRVFCEVPVASIAADENLIGRVAEVVGGRRPVIVVTQAPGPPVPGARLLGSVRSAFDELALAADEVPSTVGRQMIGAYVYEIPAPGA